MNDEVMPHVDLIAKLELEAINDLLCDGFAGQAAVALGRFLDNVHVMRTRGLESLSDETIAKMENQKTEEPSKETPKLCPVCGCEDGEHDWEVHYAEYRYASDC